MTVKLLRDRNFRATASMCVHRLNRHTLRDTANFLASLGVAALMAGTPQELGIWKRYAQEYALTFDEAWQMYREYIPQWYAEADWSKVSACGGGCLLDGMTDAGDMLSPTSEFAIFI